MLKSVFLNLKPIHYIYCFVGSDEFKPDGSGSDDSMSSGEDEVEMSSPSEPESPNAVCVTYLTKAGKYQFLKIMYGQENL